MALEPQLKQKSLDTEKLMEKLQIDQEEADKVSVKSYWVATVSWLFTVVIRENTD